MKERYQEKTKIREKIAEIQNLFQNNKTAKFRRKKKHKKKESSGGAKVN